MSDLGFFAIAVIVTFLLLGGPLTLFVAIKLLNSAWGSPKARFVRLKPASPGDPALGVGVFWDDESFPMEIFRVKIDFMELVMGGRSTSFSYTFEGKGSKKKSFVIPMKLSPADLEMLTDSGLDARAVARSFVFVEIENSKGETSRFKLKKSELLRTVTGVPLVASPEVELMAPRDPDNWSLQTRVFPWRAVVATAEEPKEKAAAGAAKKKGPSLLNFLVTKVWIEPGCIVCDACENEAPQVFEVLADTCIVRPAAPLDDAASIVAAAEGCPVDVIKYETKPKPADATAVAPQT